jgi:outer membrane protein
MIRRILVVLAANAALGLAQTAVQRLKLAQAEQIAVKNNPSIAAAESQAQASAVVPTEIRAAFYPTLSGNLTGAGSPPDTRIAAGGLNNPVIYSRLASGVSASQMITDFGRTSALADSARLRANAEFETHKATRAEVRLQVNRAYYAGLRAQATVDAAASAVAARQRIVDYVRALASSNLKSDLDVRFAEVSLAEAKLLLETAGNDRGAADAELSRALGYPGPRRFELVDEPPRELPSTDPARLIAEAFARRPEVAGRRFDVEAAAAMVRAEKKLRLPSVSAVATVGGIPSYAEKLGNNYFAAAGLNVSVPLLNGGLYRARRVEAEHRQQATRRRLEQTEQTIARNVSVAVIGAQSAAQRIALSAQLVDHASLALDLAQARYDLGLSSILELSQAQLAQTNAQIQNIAARYDYALQRAVLAYEIGELQ